MRTEMLNFWEAMRVCRTEEPRLPLACCWMVFSFWLALVLGCQRRELERRDLEEEVRMAYPYEKDIFDFLGHFDWYVGERV